MNILDFLALGGSIASILGIFLYFYQKTNNKLMKSIGDRMDEGFKRMDEGFRKMDEGFRTVVSKIDEGHRIIARLIVVQDKQKRRRLIEELRPSKGSIISTRLLQQN